MAITIEELQILVDAEVKDAIRGLSSVQKETDKTAQKFKKFGDGAIKVGKSLTAAVTLPVAAISVGLVKAASDAEETAAKFNTVFETIPQAATTAAEELAASFNFSQTEAQKLLAGTGDLLVGFGATSEQALGLSTTVQELAADLASFNNLQGGAEQASQILTKALLGERDALTTLGVKISEADVQNELLLRGQKDLTGQALLLAKAEATVGLILAQTGKAQGDVARTSDSFANQIRRLKADVSDLAVSFGRELLPVATEILGRVRDLVKRFSDLDESQKKTILTIAGLAAAAGPATTAIGILSKAIGFLVANPVIAGIAAVAAGVGAIVVAVNKVQKQRVQEAFNGVAAELKEASAAGENLAEKIREVSLKTGFTIAQVTEVAEAQGLVTDEIRDQVEAIQSLNGNTEVTAKQIVKENRALKDFIGTAVNGGGDITEIIINFSREAEVSQERVAAIARSLENVSDEQREQIDLFLAQKKEAQGLAAAELERAAALDQTTIAQETARKAAEEIARAKQEELAAEESLAQLRQAEADRIAGVIANRQAAEAAYRKTIDEINIARNAGLIDAEEATARLVTANETLAETLIAIGYDAIGDQIGDISLRRAIEEANRLKAEILGIQKAEQDAAIAAAESEAASAEADAKRRARLAEIHAEYISNIETQKQAKLEAEAAIVEAVLARNEQLLEIDNMTTEMQIEAEVARLERARDLAASLVSTEQDRADIVESFEKRINDTREAFHQEELRRTAATKAIVADLYNSLNAVIGKYFENRLELATEGSEEEKRLLRNQFVINKAVAAGEAAVNTALAVTKSLTAAPFPVNAILAAATAALGAVQIGLILAEPMPAFQQGGEFTVPPGFPNDGFPINVSSGEEVEITPERGAGLSGGDTVILRIGDREFTGYIEEEISNGNILIPRRSVV